MKASRQLVLVLLVLLANTAVAQITDDFLLKSIEESQPDYADDQDAVKTGALGGFVRDSILSSRGYNSTASLEDGATDISRLRENRAKQNNATYFGAFDSHQDAMDSELIKNFMNESGKGRVALYKYAQLQTEPSIATGSSLAQDLVFNIQRQVLEGDRAFREQISSNPELSEVMLATYNGCIKTQVAAGSTWIRAISECQNDRVTTGGTPASTFDALTPVVLDASQHHPDRLSPQVLQGGSDLPLGVRSATSVSVIDSLLNQAASSGIPSDILREFGENFRKWFGDINVQFEPGSSGKDLIVKEARRAPEKNIDQLVDELAAERFDTLMEVLKTACEATYSESASFGQGTATSGLWIMQAANQEKLRKLSAFEFSLKFTHIHNLTMLILNAVREEQKPCYLFNKSIGSSAAPVVAEDPMIAVYNQYYMIAQAIAVQQILWSFERALELTSALAGVGDDVNPLRDKAFSLIKEPLGTLDFEKLRHANKKALEVLLEQKVFVSASQEAGQAGASLVATVGK